MKSFVSAESFSSLSTENKLLSMSIWENEDVIKKWCNLKTHRESQLVLRLEDFVDYKITVVTPVRTYTMFQRANAQLIQMIILK